MAVSKGLRISVGESAALRRWISRAFIFTILVYLVIIAYLVAESVMGASRWAPYGVNIPAFISLVIASEVVITLTAVWIFREDSGIWPPAVADGWRMLRDGKVGRGLSTLLAGAWDVPLIDLRLRTPSAILLGRVNRVAALVPLAYALIASAGGAPWGLRSSALLDVALTLAVWAFMEIVMVRPGQAADATAPLSRSGPAIPAHYRAAVAPARKESTYFVRRLERSDLARVLEIERIKWKDQAASEEMILSRLHEFPEGQLAAIHVTTVDGEPVRQSLVAWSTVMPARADHVESIRAWDELTAGGTIRGSDNEGVVLVGVNLTSVTEGATYLLLGEILAHVVEWGKTKLVGGGRLNGFVAFNERRRNEGLCPFTADQYARLKEIRGYRFNERRVDAGELAFSDRRYLSFVAALRRERDELPLADDERPDYVCSNVRGYMSIPGTRLVAVVPDYFNDPASADYGVVIEWPNPIPSRLVNTRWVQRIVAGRIRSEVQREWEGRKRRVRGRSAARRAGRVPPYLRRPAESGVPAAAGTADASEADEVLEASPGS